MVTDVFGLPVPAAVFGFAVIAAAAALAARRCLRASWAAALVPPSAAVLLLLFAHKIASSVFYNENWMRLQKTFFLWREGRLYLPADEGPALNTIYGPGTALAYSAAVLFRDPEAAMYAASASAIAFFFVPAGFCFARAGGTDRLRAALAFCAFAFTVFFVPSLRNAAFRVHADAPMLGAAFAACAFLHAGLERRRARWLWGSALAAGLAVFTKQVALPLVPALACAAALRHGPREGLRQLGRGVAALALLGAASAAFFDRSAMFFHMVALPSRHPLEGGAALWLRICSSFGREWLAALAIAHFSVRPLVLDRTLPVSRRLAGPMWSLLFLAGLWMVPAALLARVKIGGSLNTLSTCNAFFFAAAFAAFAEGGPPAGMARARVPRALAILAGALLLAQTASLVHKTFFAAREPRYARTAYEYIRRHPGEAYFPRLALVHLLAEGRHVHDAAALMDREWARMPIPAEAFDRHLPPRLGLVAFYEGSEDDMRRLPRLSAFSELGGDSELPGFRVYRRPKG